MDDNKNKSVDDSNNIKNESNSNNEQYLKKGFFKKIWYSIFKLEKYGEMSAEGVSRALTYLVKLALIVALIISLGTIFQINEMVKKGITFLDEQVGEFSYKKGILELEDKKTIVAPSSTFGQIIVDTNIENTEEINKYLNSMETNKGILILKDKVLVKGMSGQGTLSYTYKSLLDEANVEELNKQQVMEYVNGSNTWKVYILIFALMLGYSLINTFLPILFNAFLLSLFGYLVTWFAKIRIRFAAIFNLSAYSLTLSIILNAIYIAINIFINFDIKYFQIMYIAVAAIYLIAAIFLIKSEFIKRQIELTKQIQQKNEEDRQKELEKQKEKKEEKNDKEDKEKDKNKDGKKKGKNGTDVGAEPEGV